MQRVFLLFSLIFFFGSCMSQTNQEKEKIEKISYINNLNKKTFPEPIGYVNDFALVLDSIHQINLETKLNNYDKETNNQIAIITLDSEELTEDNFDEYELSRYWGVGTKEKNNGLTIVLSPKLRRMRINTGLGTEKILTDAICEKHIENHNHS